MNDKPKTLQEKRDRVARFEKEVVNDDQKSIFEKMEESRKFIKENEEIYSPKATPEDLKEASKAMGIVIPKEIENLYLNHTGEAPDRTVEFRLMPLWQVWDTHEMYRSMGDFSEVLNKYHLHFFWTDTESSFLGMFTDGPLIDRIALEEHDGYFSGDHSPLFRSSKSLLEQLERIDRWNRIADENEEEGREKEEAVAAFGEHFDFPYETPWDSVPFS
ncbi:MAG: hypothetical protein KC917_23050, partial [Candidatus Omnitrophica bacterium]|nr:hypothetical protein [Candidatus Omnitrophota bacterium]